MIRSDPKKGENMDLKYAQWEKKSRSFCCTVSTVVLIMQPPKQSPSNPQTHWPVKFEFKNTRRSTFQTALLHTHLMSLKPTKAELHRFLEKFTQRRQDLPRAHSGLDYAAVECGVRQRGGSGCCDL